MAERPYSLGHRESRGQVLGWRLGQAGSLAVGVLAAVLGVDLGGGFAVPGLVVLAAGVAVATVPLGGRGADEWVPVVASHAVRVRGGALAPAAAVVESRGAPAHLAWPDGRATVLAEVRHRGLLSLGDEPRAVPEAVATWLRGLGRPGQRPVVTLLTTTGPGTAARSAPWNDPGCGVRSFVALTADGPVDLAAALRRHGVADALGLDAAAIAALLEARVRPGHATLLDCDVATRWRHLAAAATLHASFVVEEWPTGSLDEQALAAMCVARDRRSIAIHVAVEELAGARERAARVRTARAADRSIAAASGFLRGPGEERAARRDDERQAELAAGHGSLRVLGVVGLDARDELELEAAAARLLADATACGVRLRRCDGDHRRGVLATVPGWCVP